MGNPLLDMQVTNGEALLEKYKIKANDAILAGSTHAPIYDELAKSYKVNYVAGGASQNTARGAAYILPPKSVVFTGCVGDDDLAEQLKAANRREGLDEVYLVKKGEKTGACAVVITGHHRSLVTDLRSAEKFEISHLSSPAVAPLIEAAKVFYVEGYFLTHGVDSILMLGKKSSASNKIFALNLSAPFLLEFFNEQLGDVLPYCDILIGNESEAEMWANKNGLPGTQDLAAIAKAVALVERKNADRPRIVVFTSGAEPTVLVSSAEPDNPKFFPVTALKDSEIIDTNGAGDAFAGGFLAALISGKSWDQCVEVGHAMGTMCIQQIGPQYKWPKVKVL